MELNEPIALSDVEPVLINSQPVESQNPAELIIAIKERDEVIVLLREALSVINRFVKLVGSACPDAYMWDCDNALADQSGDIELRITAILEKYKEDK